MLPQTARKHGTADTRIGRSHATGLVARPLGRLFNAKSQPVNSPAATSENGNPFSLYLHLRKIPKPFHDSDHKPYFLVFRL